MCDDNPRSSCKAIEKTRPKMPSQILIFHLYQVSIFFNTYCYFVMLPSHHLDYFYTEPKVTFLDFLISLAALDSLTSFVEGSCWTSRYALLFSVFFRSRILLLLDLFRDEILVFLSASTLIACYF